MILFAVLPDEEQSQFSLNQEIPEELFPRIANGDMQALEVLYRKTSSAIYGFLLSILKNKQDAEDILQDTYLKIRGAAHLYAPQGKPLAWIFTIAKNLAYMQLRKNSHLSKTPYEELDQVVSFSLVPQCEDRLLLEAAFSILSDEERQIIILHANTGMKHREIASLLNLPLSTTLSKYHRGLRKLKTYMECEVDEYAQH